MNQNPLPCITLDLGGEASQHRVLDIFLDKQWTPIQPLHMLFLRFANWKHLVWQMWQIQKFQLVNFRIKIGLAPGVSSW